MSRHLLAAGDLSRDQAVAILDDADRFAQALVGREVRKLPTLQGRTVLDVLRELHSHPGVIRGRRQVDERRRDQRQRAAGCGQG